MGISWNEGSGGSFGGTERLGREIERRLPPELLDRFQIHLNWEMPADQEKIQILWCHTQHGEPEHAHLADNGWRKFHRIVFVSNWQAQNFINYFNIPWSRCVVMRNAIEPIIVSSDRFDPVPADRPIRLIYSSAPNRGLIILYHVFQRICDETEDVELDVFSSFSLYGWQNGAWWENFFKALKQAPRINYRGVVPNHELRNALINSHVFAYPLVQIETCCLCLIEAMSAGLACVHPNYAALYETAADHTMMYQWQEDWNAHAAVFHQTLRTVINALRDGNKGLLSKLAAQKSYADDHYNWDFRARQWEAFLHPWA